MSREAVRAGGIWCHTGCLSKGYCCTRRTGENISARHVCDLIFRWEAPSPTAVKRSPKVLYPRARVRLYHGYGIDRLHSVLGVRTRRAKVSLLGKFWFIRGLINYNSIWKPTLLKRGNFSNFRSLHSPNLSQSARHLLPIQHFRFAPLPENKDGIAENCHYRSSVDHLLCRNRYKPRRRGMVHYFIGNQDR